MPVWHTYARMNTTPIYQEIDLKPITNIETTYWSIIEMSETPWQLTPCQEQAQRYWLHLRRLMDENPEAAEKIAPTLDRYAAHRMNSWDDLENLKKEYGAIVGN